MVVFRTTDAQGQLGVRVMTINGLDAFSVPTLLRYAVKLQEQNLGI